VAELMQVCKAFVIGLPGNCNGKPAPGKTQSPGKLYRLVFLCHHIFAYNAYIGYSIGYIAWDVFVTEEKEFCWEIVGFCLEFACTVVKVNSTFFDEFEGVFRKPA
jgi:hypothetical protein